MMPAEIYQFALLMGLLFMGGALFCLIGALVERWIK